MIIIALCQGARLLSQVFFSTRNCASIVTELTAREKGNVLGDAAREAVQALKQRFMVAVMIPAITVATQHEYGFYVSWL